MQMYFKLFPGCDKQYVKILVLLHSIENVHSEIFNVFNWAINMLYLKISYSKNSCQIYCSLKNKPSDCLIHLCFVFITRLFIVYQKYLVAAPKDQSESPKQADQLAFCGWHQGHLPRLHL